MKANYSWLDRPWIKSHVDDHLFFGLYKSKLKSKLAGLLISVFYYFCFVWIVMSEGNIIPINTFFESFHIGVIIAISFIVLFSNYYRAAIYWCAAKITLTIISFIFILYGFIHLFIDLERAAFLIIFGLIWLPSLEFSKFIKDHQKILTGLRLILNLIMIEIAY